MATKKPKPRGRYGDGAIFRRADTGAYVVRLELGERDGKRRRWETTARTMEEAREKLDKARAEKSSTGTVSAKIKAGVWMDSWLETIVAPKCKPNVVALYRGTVEKWLRPALGDTALGSITPHQVRTLILDVEAKTSAGNAARVLRILRACLQVAVDDLVIPRNVARRAEMPVSTVTRGSLSASEARKLVKHLNGRPDRAGWLLALLTGIRQAERLGLTWDRVDLRNGTIEISAQLQQLPASHGCGTGEDGKPKCGRQRVTYCPKVKTAEPRAHRWTPLEGTFVLIEPKSDAGKRVIPLPVMLIAALREHRKANLANPHGLVFVSRDSRSGAIRPVSRRVDSQAWHDLCKSAGVPDVPEHSARHTTATLLMDLGVPDTVSQQILGHSSVRVSQGYQHADLTMARKAIDELGQAIG